MAAIDGSGKIWLGLGLGLRLARSANNRALVKL